MFLISGGYGNVSGGLAPNYDCVCVYVFVRMVDFDFFIPLSCGCRSLRLPRFSLRGALASGAVDDGLLRPWSALISGGLL